MNHVDGVTYSVSAVSRPLAPASVASDEFIKILLTVVVTLLTPEEYECYEPAANR